MKSLLVFLSFCVTVSQISGAELNVTIYYHNYGYYVKDFFTNQVNSVLHDPTIRELIHFELVPFGFCSFQENPPQLFCYKTPNTCWGNTMNACIFARNHDDCRQAEFVTCCQFEENPSSAGKKCAKKLGLNSTGLGDCINGYEGVELEIMYGKQTLRVRPKVNFIPAIAYDNVYKYEEQSDSLYDFKSIIIRKLRAKGIQF